MLQYVPAGAMSDDDDDKCYYYLSIFLFTLMPSCYILFLWF